MIKILKIKSWILLLIYILSVSHKLQAKNYDLETFICADEIGPRLEFIIPNFNNNKQEKDFTFKFYELKNRKSYSIKQGIIKKVSSPIDDSYSYYQANSIANKKEFPEITIEFYPPSHLLLQNFNSQFIDLVCWKD